MEWTPYGTALMKQFDRDQLRYQVIDRLAQFHAAPTEEEQRMHLAVAIELMARRLAQPVVRQ